MPDTQPNIPQVDASGRLIPFRVFARCTENDIDYDYEGGKVLLQAIGHQELDQLNGGNFVFQFQSDEAMRAFPITRAEKQTRFFEVTFREIDNPIPPETPAPETEVARLERENEALRQQLAAADAEQLAPA